MLGRASAVALAIALTLVGAALARTAPSGLVYSSASGRMVQRQPSSGSCHATGSGLYALPDSRCTPGAVNPSVTQRTIRSTICRGGWTATVRPSVSVTEPEKFASMEAYGARGSASRYEYDHLVPLELGGAVNDPRNLWPQLDYPSHGFYLNPKDRLENVLHRLVCHGSIGLSRAQRMIATDWVAAYREYG
jgi:hypothetical protein